MYRCDICNTIVGPSVKVIKRVSKKRNKEYVNEIKDKKGSRRKVYSDGWEIAKEVALCHICDGKDILG